MKIPNPKVSQIQFLNHKTESNDFPLKTVYSI